MADKFLSRPFGSLGNSFGTQMPGHIRTYLVGRFGRVSKEVTEFGNHGWGLLASYLGQAGDAVIAAANNPAATWQVVRAAMEFHELSNWYVQI